MQWTAVVEEQIPAGVDWLSPAEFNRAAGMRFTKRRTEYLLRRLAGKRAVATALWGQEATRVQDLGRVALLNRRTGAPYAEVDGQPAGLDVSLTDRAGCGVALVGDPGTMSAGSLGIDIEIVEPRSASFVTDYLTPPEQEYVASQAAQTPNGHDVAANLLWSAKEAALKVLRVGLRADTRRVVVTIEHTVRADGWAQLHVDSGQETFPGWWRRDGDFLLTLCTRQFAEPPSRLPGSIDLTGATPTHSWAANPVAPVLENPPPG